MPNAQGLKKAAVAATTDTAAMPQEKFFVMVTLGLY